MNYHFRECVIVVFAMLLIGATVGCNKDPYDIVELEGVATFDGKPLHNVNLIFRPKDDSGKTSTALVTDPGGKFVVAYSANRKGVKAGDIEICVGVIDMSGFEANEAGKAAIEQYGYQAPRLSINLTKSDKNYILDLKPRK